MKLASSWLEGKPIEITLSNITKIIYIVKTPVAKTIILKTVEIFITLI